MDLTFFYAPGTISLASVIALEETGIPYTAEKIDFASKQQQSAAFLKVNPKARVPALAGPNGVLTETPAILTYISSIAPEAGLMPTDPWAAAQVQSYMSYFASTVHVNHAHRMRGYRWADGDAAQDAMKARVAGNMSDCFALIERDILRGPWVMGDTYTVADAHLFTIARWLEADGVEPSAHPAIVDHVAAMSERPAVQRAVKLAA